MNFPSKCVVDTNVLVVANLKAQSDPNPEVPNACILACVDAIEHVQNHALLVIDEGGEIFDEYMRQFPDVGYPGVDRQKKPGDLFMKWMHKNQWREDKCERVTITKDGDSYMEFPSDEALKNFDSDDRMFVAVAHASQNNPSILQATDSEWWEYDEALSQAGIQVCFLCPDYIEAKHARKYPKT